MSATNFNTMLLENFRRYAHDPAVMVKRQGRFTSLNYRHLEEMVVNIARGLLSLGFTPGQRAVILSRTRAEWLFADLGSLLAGGWNSAIYPQSLPEEIAYILNDLKATLLFIENREQWEKVQAVRSRIPSLKWIIWLTGEFPATHSDCMSLPELIRRGEQAGNVIPSGKLRDIAAGISGDDPLCIIYTSGTTGRPKGVVLTHRNYLDTMQAVLDFIPDHERLRRHFSFLPLAHSFERFANYLVLYMGRCVAHAEDMDTLMEDMQAVRPHLVTAVPRFFEKVYARIQEGLAEASPWRRKLFIRAQQIGEAEFQYALRGKPLPPGLRWQYHLADRLVFRKVRRAFGGEIVYFISGGAPLNPRIARYFRSLGLLILEGWGATELTAPATLNPPDDYRFGTVGYPLPGVHIRVAEDGELEVKGVNVFKGYWNDPRATRAAFTADGYYRTGDIGAVDDAGRITITDRKKQIIVTAGGKNIPPAPIEQMLCSQPHIDMAFVHGDRRKYLTALLTLDEGRLRQTARELGLETEQPEQLGQHPRIQALVRQEVEAVNRQLPRYMQIKYFRILPEPFSLENGQMTHTLKLRRRIIEERYRELLDEMYPESG